MDWDKDGDMDVAVAALTLQAAVLYVLFVCGVGRCTCLCVLSQP